MAPASASSAVFTSFSVSTKASASSSGVPSVLSCAYISIASGSRPFSLALEALVAFFCLKGLYRSSTRCRTSAFSICSCRSGVSFPCSSISLITSSFLSSRPLRYFSLLSISLRITSRRPPVTSFLYRAMKGMVFPSSMSPTVFSTCSVFTLNSAAIFLIISIFIPCV